MNLVEKHIVKRTDRRYKELLELCHLSKNLYNTVLYTIRQHFFEIPILFKYKIQTSVDNLKVQPFLGGFIAIGLGGETRFYNADPLLYPVDERGRYKRGTFSDGAFRAFDAGLKMGCGMSYRNFYAELSYSIGIMNAAQKEFNDFGFDNFDNSIHNGNFAITLGLDF